MDEQIKITRNHDSIQNIGYFLKKEWALQEV